MSGNVRQHAGSHDRSVNRVLRGATRSYKCKSINVGSAGRACQIAVSMQLNRKRYEPRWHPCTLNVPRQVGMDPAIAYPQGCSPGTVIRTTSIERLPDLMCVCNLISRFHHLGCVTSGLTQHILETAIQSISAHTLVVHRLLDHLATQDLAQSAPAFAFLRVLSASSESILNCDGQSTSVRLKVEQCQG